MKPTAKAVDKTGLLLEKPWDERFSFKDGFNELGEWKGAFVRFWEVAVDRTSDRTQVRYETERVEEGLPVIRELHLISRPVDSVETYERKVVDRVDVWMKGFGCQVSIQATARSEYHVYAAKLVKGGQEYLHELHLYLKGAFEFRSEKLFKATDVEMAMKEINNCIKMCRDASMLALVNVEDPKGYFELIRYGLINVVLYRYAHAMKTVELRDEFLRLVDLLIKFSPRESFYGGSSWSRDLGSGRSTYGEATPRGVHYQQTSLGLACCMGMWEVAKRLLEAHERTRYFESEELMCCLVKCYYHVAEFVELMGKFYENGQLKGRAREMFVKLGGLREKKAV